MGHSRVWGRLWWKRKYTLKKTGKKLSVKLLCGRYVDSSHIEKIFFIWRNFETASYTDLQRDIWEHILAYGVKGDIVRQKLERNFLRNCFGLCAFRWGSYASFIIRQCFNKVLLKVKKWYFATRWKLLRKVKYPEVKHRKKCSKKMLSNTGIHFREVKFTLHCPVWKLCLWGIFEVLLRGAPGLVVSKETTSDEYWREAFRATALWCVYSSRKVTSFFGLKSLKSLFLWKLRKNIWEHY